MISGETRELGDASTSDEHGTKNGGGKNRLRDTVVLLSIPVIVALIAYITVPAQKPLLDEQFLFHWIKDCAKLEGSSSIAGFFGWPGFERYDHWGPVTHAVLLCLGAIFGKAVALFRVFSILLHAGASALVYSIARGLRLSKGVALSAAVLFAVYPLSVETVAWVGGFGTQLSVTLLLASLAIYSNLKKDTLDWLKLGACLVAFALALGSSTAVWFAPLLILWLELCALPFRKEDADHRDFTSIIVPFLLLSVISAISVAAGGLGSITVPDFSLNNIAHQLRDVFFPINQTLFNKYPKEYVLAYVLLGLTVPPLGLALWKSPASRKSMLVASGWLALCALPFCGIAMSTPDLYGSHWLYLAALPIALLAGTACNGAAEALKKHRWPMHILAGILTLLLAVFYVRHLWTTEKSYSNNARLLAFVQKSIKTANSKVNRPYLLVRDLPDRLALAPHYRPIGPACFDTDTGLLSSGAVPEGHLKDLLKEGKFTEQTLRWEPSIPSLISLDLTPPQTTLPAELKMEDIAFRLEPALPFYKTVSKDPVTGCLILETNSQNGPMITLTACELSPLDGDYLCLDARIDCPASVVSPAIELHWQTRVHPTFERKERFSYTRPVVNDQQFHRYYLSLRRNGWTTGGAPRVIALGFPSGAKVWLKSMNIERGVPNAPKLEFAGIPGIRGPQYSAPYYKFPTDKDLRIYSLADIEKVMKAKYAVENVANATGVLVEVSKPDVPFDDANSNHLSSVTYRTYSHKGLSGEIAIPVNELDGAGVYSIRAVATDENGGYCGMFSDALQYRVSASNE